MPKFAYVSVAKSAQEWMTIAQLEEFAAYRWGTTAAKGMECERLIAVYEQTSIAAWAVRGAYADTVGTYSKGRGDKRPRTVFDVGDPLPVFPIYNVYMPPSASLTAGVVIVDVSEDDLVDLDRVRTYPSGLERNVPTDDE